MENPATIEQPGTCPICKSTMIEYGTPEVVDDQMFYPASCENDHGFKEWYKLIFLESEANA